MHWLQMRHIAAGMSLRSSAPAAPLTLPHRAACQLQFPLQCGVSYSVESMRPVVPAPPAPPSPYTPTDSQSIALPVEKGHTRRAGGSGLNGLNGLPWRGLGGGVARW